MEEADYLCNRVAIVDHGKIVAMDSPKNLKDSLGGDVVAMELAENGMDLGEGFKGHDWVKGVDHHDGTLDLRVSNADKHLPEIFAMAERKGVAINSVNIRKPSLEDVFLKYTGKTIRESEASQMEQMKARRHHR